jgi:aspartate kinase
MLVIRELLSGLGEAHSAYVTTLLLRRAGRERALRRPERLARRRDLTLDERSGGLDGIDLTSELPIVTGYAQCARG